MNKGAYSAVALLLHANGLLPPLAPRSPALLQTPRVLYCSCVRAWKQEKGNPFGKHLHIRAHASGACLGRFRDKNSPTLACLRNAGCYFATRLCYPQQHSRVPTHVPSRSRPTTLTRAPPKTRPSRDCPASGLPSGLSRGQELSPTLRDPARAPEPKAQGSRLRRARAPRDTAVT